MVVLDAKVNGFSGMVFTVIRPVRVKIERRKMIK